MLACISRYSDMRRWVPGGAPDFAAAYPTVPLGDLLRPRRQRVPPADFAAHTPITIHFGGEIVRRDRAEPFKGGMFAVFAGDLVFSKIDLRNGAIGLMPADLAPGVVTSEYPSYIPDTEQVDPRYLAMILRSPNFKHLLRIAASGTSGRKRVAGDSFEELEMPLPDPAEQARMVDEYESAVIRSAKFDAQADAIEKRGIAEFEAALGLAPPPDLPKRPLQIARFRDMDRWSHEGALHHALVGDAPPESKFDIVPLEDVATVTYGLQKCPQNRPGKHARPYLRVANVQRGVLDLREIKHIDVPDADMPKYALREGDVLLCEGNSPDLVGRGAIWHNEIPDCVHQNHVLRVRIRPGAKVLPDFVLEYINSPNGQAYFRSKAKRTTNLASINSREVGAMPLPLPDTTQKQRQLMRRFQDARDRATAKRQQAAKLREEAWTDFLTAIFQ